MMGGSVGGKSDDIHHWRDIFLNMKIRKSEPVIRELSDGDFFGEHSMAKVAHPTSALAIDYCDMLFLTSHDMEYVCKDYPPLKEILTSVGERRREDATFHPGKEVLSKYTKSRRRTMVANSPDKKKDGPDGKHEEHSRATGGVDSLNKLLADTETDEEGGKSTSLSRRMEKIERSQSQMLDDVHDIKRSLRSLTTLMQKVHKEFESSPRNVRRNSKLELNQ